MGILVIKRIKNNMDKFIIMISVNQILDLFLVKLLVNVLYCIIIYYLKNIRIYILLFKA